MSRSSTPKGGAHDYLALDALREGDRILSRIGNGLDAGELMPVEYEYRDSGYSLTAVERRVGRGAILCTSLLVGTKRGLEPVADILLGNLIRRGRSRPGAWRALC